MHVARVRRIECILYHTFQKIADFGLSHDMDDDYYYKPKGGMIPVKWTSPEAVLYKKYTTKSDVWSYGMVPLYIINTDSTIVSNEQPASPVFTEDYMEMVALQD